MAANPGQWARRQYVEPIAPMRKSNITRVLCRVCRNPLHRILVLDNERVHYLCGPVPR